MRKIGKILMKFSFKKIDDNIFIYNNNKKFKLLKNKNFIVKDKKIAKIVIYELNKFGIKNFVKLPVTSISMAISSLVEHDRKQLKKEVIKILNFDSSLYRHHKNTALNRMLEKNLNDSIDYFNSQFSTKLRKIYTSLGEQKNINTNNFSTYLQNLKLQNLYLFYRISKLNNSVVLTYNYFSNCYGITKLFNLGNIESKYQRSIWGSTMEQKKIDDEEKRILKSFSIFF